MNIRNSIKSRIQSVIQWSVFRGHIVAWLALIAALPLVVYAATNELNVFAPNTVISSSKVNENFVMLDERIGVYEDAISVDGNNNVGIGTVSPRGKLEIKGALVLNRDISSQTSWLQDNGGLSVSSQHDIAFITGTTSDVGGSDYSKERMRIGQDGNVGIGTSGPSDALEVFRSGSDASLALTAGGTQRWQLFSKASTGNFDLVQQGIGTRLSVTNGGSVGIGTTSPSAKLSVTGGGIFTDAISVASISGGGSSFWGPVSIPQGKLTVNVPSGDTATFMGGNVGIGTTSPTSPLHVVGDVTHSLSNPAQGKWGWNMNTDKTFYIYDYNASAVRFLLNSVGNVGIGTTSPTQKLHVVGNVTADDYLSNSDARLKQDITPLENAVDGINCLQGVSYRWEDPTASQALQIGLIAQDVEACYPEVVTTDAKGFKSVSYARLVAPLIEVVKGQQETITALGTRDMERQRQIAVLEARLARLETRMSERK